VKVFTFFYNRYATATTSRAMAESDINHYVMMHNENDVDKFEKGNTLFGEPIVTGNGRGLAHQRNSALRMMSKNEWAVFASDDFQKIYSYPEEYIFSKTLSRDVNAGNQQAIRLKKVHQISLREMFKFFPKLIEIADANNIHLVGFGLHDNPRNLKNKFTTRGLADGRFWLVKKSTYEFDPNAQSIDDYAWTAENLVRHKNVLVLNWCVPYFARYSVGGYGSETEREAMKKKECQYLVSKYEPLIKFSEKWQRDDVLSHIKLWASDKNIAVLRKRYGLP